MKDTIQKADSIEVNGFKWYFQEFDKPDGNLDAINLYDANGDFVEEFNSMEEMMKYVM